MLKVGGITPPATPGADGARHPAGLRQTVDHGGFFFFPGRDMVVVVHYEPAGTATADVVAALAGALSS